MLVILLLSATKLQEGNVFPPVCDSVHGGSLSRGGALSRRGLSLGESLSRGSLSRGVCQRDPPDGNVRAVRILLECILVC